MLAIMPKKVHVHLSHREKIALWDKLRPMLNEHGWKQGEIEGIAVLNNNSAATWAATQLGFAVSPHNVNGLRRDYDFDFRDPPTPRVKTERKGRRRVGSRADRIEALERGYNDLYDWATSKGFTGPKQQSD